MTTSCLFLEAQSTILIANLQVDQSNHLIRSLDTISGTVTTFAGKIGIYAPFSDGIGTSATFFYPTGVAIDGVGRLAIVVGLHSTAPLMLCMLSL
jgi:DNA-binding beta-propeller fold protein YncE